jgi:hypothetical protein
MGLTRLTEAWASAWRIPRFRRLLVLALAVGAAIAWWLPAFFSYIEAKPGRFPADPIMGLIGPTDVTWLTFTVLYATMALAIASALPKPTVVLRGLVAYNGILVLRMVCMTVLTFEPPPGLIPLVDPLTASFYPGGVPFAKDLFFSGHTATLVLMACIAQGALLRWISLLAAVLVAFLVVLQHVHWTADVVAAPLFVWLSWKGSALTLRLCGVADA